MAVEDSVAQDQIKAFVDRILRMKGERRAIDADIREIYAEAKGSGFDKTVLGKLVNYVEKREADANAVMEGEALFDLYLTAYYGAGTVVATHTHEAVSKPQPTKAAGQGLAEPALSLGSSQPANTKSAPITGSQSAPQAARDLATSPSPQGQVATNYLKASTGDAQFRDPLDWEDEDGALPIQSHRAENSEGQSLSALCDKADMTGKTAGAEAPAAPDNTITFKAKPLRPNCLKPEACAGQGRNHCWPCRKAMAEEGAA